MKNFFCTLILMFAFAPFYAQAETPDDLFSEMVAEERIEHYAGTEFKNPEEAQMALNEKISDIAAILDAQADIDGTSMEKIHEISYTLENAIDFIRAEHQEDVTLNHIDEAVQALHYASEKHEADKTREWFAKLQNANHERQMNEANTSETPLVKNDHYEIVIKDHKFFPETLTVPAGEKIKLLVDNQDATPEEFESHDFNREKIISGKSKATIFVGPLEPGKYHYFGEFNMDSAKGYIIAKAAE